MGLMWGRVLAVCAIAGCGRFGFDRLGSDASALGDGLGPDSDGTTATPEVLTVPAAADTALNSFAPTLNYGAGTTFNVRSDMVSTFVGLVRFDLAGTAGSVTSATLHISTSTQVFASGRVDLARVLEAWEEGTQIGGNGVANHGVRQGTIQWTAAGCGPGSREDTPLASLQPTSANTRYEVALPSSLVQSWIDEPATNHGIALFAVGALNDTVAFFARESAMPPELIIQVVR
jgi:hypothetical protein